MLHLCLMCSCMALAFAFAVLVDAVEDEERTASDWKDYENLQRHLRKQEKRML